MFKLFLHPYSLMVLSLVLFFMSWLNYRDNRRKSKSFRKSYLIDDLRGNSAYISQALNSVDLDPEEHLFAKISPDFRQIEVSLPIVYAKKFTDALAKRGVAISQDTRMSIVEPPSAAAQDTAPTELAERVIKPQTANRTNNVLDLWMLAANAASNGSKKYMLYTSDGSHSSLFERLDTRTFVTLGSPSQNRANHRLSSQYSTMFALGRSKANEELRQFGLNTNQRAGGTIVCSDNRSTSLDILFMIAITDIIHRTPVLVVSPSRSLIQKCIDNIPREQSHMISVGNSPDVINKQALFKFIHLVSTLDDYAYPVTQLAGNVESIIFDFDNQVKNMSELNHIAHLLGEGKMLTVSMPYYRARQAMTTPDERSMPEFDNRIYLETGDVAGGVQSFDPEVSSHVLGRIEDKQCIISALDNSGLRTVTAGKVLST